MEVWKSFGLYEVSNMGSVRRNGRVLKPRVDRGDYQFVSLYEKSIQKHMKVHRLVAMCFIDNPENKQFVDHINRDRSDNRVENLRWTRRSRRPYTGPKKPNKLGHKHLFTEIKGTYEYWVIEISSLKIKKRFNKSKYTLDQVLEARDRIYLENGW